jgi:hypothetical protein
MTNGEVQLQLNKLSPSMETMSPSAVANLLDSNIAQTQYTIKSAERARNYINANNDPRNFKKWEQQYFPRDVLVNKEPIAIESQEDYDKLPPGRKYIHNGKLGVKGAQ